MNLTQVAHLEKMNLDPNVVFIFECTDDISNRFINSKMMDKDTGLTYSYFEIEHLDRVTKSRLVPLGERERQIMQQRLQAWVEVKEALKKTFASTSISIEASGSVDKLVEKLCFTLEQGF